MKILNKSTIILILTVPGAISLFAQPNMGKFEIGIINDVDGYTNIRSGKGVEYEIIDKVYDGQFFRYFPDSANWYEVNLARCDCKKLNNIYDQVIGYVHKSRISKVQELSLWKQKVLYEHVFFVEDSLFDQFRKSFNIYSKEYQILSNRVNFYHEETFDLVLSPFVNYISQTKDIKLFSSFLSILEKQSGSADETPIFTLGEVYVNNPAWVLETFKDYRGLLDHLEWGFVNNLYKIEDESRKSSLKGMLNEYRKEMGLKEVDYDNY